MANMKSEYGPKKAEQVFYASRNAGKINGVDLKRQALAKVLRAKH